MAKRTPPLNDNNLAIAYYRYSSHSQNEMSIDQQRQQAHAYADAHGLTIVREYEDAAKTGTNANRPGYQRMLAEVGKLRPHALVLWKTDRLGRDRFELVDAKRKIREAGCRLELVAELSPSDDPESVLFEAMSESFAEYYSRQLSRNIRRGMTYNAENGLYNGHAVFGYKGKPGEPYAVDETCAAAVRKMFADYAAGASMKEVCDGLNDAGFRTVRGNRFAVKSMNRMLRNRRYVGEYCESGVVIPDGMPRLVDDATFAAVQARLVDNKRKGKSAEQAARYWLSGKLVCGRCGAPMTGVSGTSATGKVYGYYYCANARKHACGMRKLRQERIEALVGECLRHLLADSELVASLAVDAAAYYAEHYGDGDYLDALRGQLADVDGQLANFARAIGMGVINDTTAKAMDELETRKAGLADAIAAEEARCALADDAHSVQAYFERYWRSRATDDETRAYALDYLVDKVVVDDDGLSLVAWFTDERDRLCEFDWEMLSGLGDFDPFVRAEVDDDRFDGFCIGSTKCRTVELFLTRERLAVRYMGVLA